MTQSKTFLKVAALSAILSAATTFLLWLLPNLFTAASSFEEGLLLPDNSYYITLKWVNFIHIPLALMGYFGLAFILYKRQPAKSIFGMVWFTIWGTIEMIGIAIILFSLNYNWRTNYQNADNLTRVAYKNNIEMFTSVWDSMFFVLLIAFLLGTIFLAWATWKSKGLEKVVSYLLWLSVPLTILITLKYYADQSWAGKITDYFYPALQPISRFLMGVFIWKNCKERIST